MIWRFCNFVSSLIAGLLTKDRLAFISMRRSISIATHKIVSFLLIIFFLSASIYLSCLAFNVGGTRDKVLALFANQLRYVHNLSFGFFNKQSPIVTVNELRNIDKIEIENIANKYTASQNIAMVDLNQIYAEIKENPLVRDVYIRRYFDNKIKIIVFEKKINFLVNYQSKETSTNKTFIVDSDSSVIEFKKVIPNSLRDAPIINATCEGEKLHTKIETLQRAIFAFNNFYPNVMSADLFECMSWTINLKDGTKLLLSDEDEIGSLYKYFNHTSYLQTIKKKIESIDLRFSGKIYVKKSNEPIMQTPTV